MASGVKDIKRDDLVHIAYSQKDIETIERALDGILHSTPTLVAHAAKQTAYATKRKILPAYIQKRYSLKTKSHITKDMTVRRSSGHDPVYDVRIESHVEALSYFKYKFGKHLKKRGEAAMAAQLQGGNLKSLQKGDIKAFVTTFKSGHTAIATRTNPGSSHKIRQLYGSSVVTMVGNEERGAWKEALPVIAEKLRTETERGIAFYIRKANGKVGGSHV